MVFNFQFYFWFLTISLLGLYQRLRAREDSNYIYFQYICILLLFFLVVFFSHIDTTLLRRWVVLQNTILCISLRLGISSIFLMCLSGTSSYYLNVFVCPILNHNQVSHYDWYCSSFTLSVFRSVLILIISSILLIWGFFTPADSFPQESEWQKVL